MPQPARRARCPVARAEDTKEPPPGVCSSRCTQDGPFVGDDPVLVAYQHVHEPAPQACSGVPALMRTTDGDRDPRATAQAVELLVDRPAGRLVGSLLLPAAPGPHPTALLLPGSGPVDRDSDAPRLPIGITRALAHSLAAAGVASFRYDKRGVGASPGDWRRAGLWDGADDARAALRLLATRPEVDPARLVLIGHSEGAVLATAIGADTDVRLAGVGLLSPTARTGEEVLLWQAQQLARGLSAPVRAILTIRRTDLVDSVRKNHDRIRRTTTEVARIGGVRTNARWYREFMDHDPRADLRRLHLPVLALTGDKDLQSPPEDLKRVAELVQGPVEAHVVPDVTHLLRHQPAAASLRHYRREITQPLDPRVLQLVTAWTVAVTRHRHGTTSHADQSLGGPASGCALVEGPWDESWVWRLWSASVRIV